MQLRYKRNSLIGAALITLVLGLVVLMIAMGPIEGRRGLVGYVVLLLGPVGAKVLSIGVGALAIVGALRLLWLTLDDALAAKVVSSGIFVRSFYSTTLLPWKSIASIDCRVIGGWGKTGVLVIDRTDNAGFLLHLVGLGGKIVIQPKLLEADDSTLHAWIDAARNRRNPSADTRPRHPIHQRRVFGRR